MQHFLGGKNLLQSFKETKIYENIWKHLYRFKFYSSLASINVWNRCANVLLLSTFISYYSASFSVVNITFNDTSLNKGSFDNIFVCIMIKTSQKQK